VLGKENIFTNHCP